MPKYNIISNIVYCIILILIIIYCCLYRSENKDIADFFYWTAIFTAFIAVDFTLYVLYSKQAKELNHLHYAVFDKSRFHILLKEIISYFNRPFYILLLLASYVFLALVYQLFRDVTFVTLLLFFISYLIHLSCIAFILFSWKNWIGKRDYNTGVRNIQVYIIFVTVLIVIVSDKVVSLRDLIVYFPLSGAFYVSLTFPDRFYYSPVIAVLIIFIVLIIDSKKFKEWPV